MKKITAIVLGIAVSVLVAGCVDNGRYHGSVAMGYGGYYDDYYGPGPFYDGYWGGDGAFYFSDGPGHDFRRDEGRHFRHERMTGYHEFHGNRPGGGHGGGPGGGGGHGDHAH